MLLYYIISARPAPAPSPPRERFRGCEKNNCRDSRYTCIYIYIYIYIYIERERYSYPLPPTTRP